ncbi:MAG: acylneuraminate cytidylyltransferase [Crocinitomicaceae bacterium]|nr:acylneuraminate cytidylyltransferase [Crocinitomicaceae bacterium]|tara:strand:+ start:3829 stop:4569 length:741 start_codon:yes stop_codon:yes gene_type:complete
MKSEDMILGTSSLAVIPARSGSKSIKNKNTKLFNGKPLIAWTIEQAIASNITRVIVTTDCEITREVAIKYGAEVPYLRSKKLSSDTVGIEPVIIDLLDYLKDSELYVPSCVALLMPTSPFRKMNDINVALRMFFCGGVSCVISVTPAIANNNPHWMLKENSDNSVRLFNGQNLSEIRTRRQDLPNVYIRNDFIYALAPKNLYMNKPGLYGANPKLMKISDNRVDVDINTQLDWDVAEILFNKVNAI